MTTPSTTRIDTWLETHGPSVLRHVTGQARSDTPVQVTRITDRNHAAVVELDCGAQRLVAKIFDAYSQDARNACEREAYALHSLRGTGLAPRLHIYANDAAFVVMDAVPGQMLSERLDAANLLDHAERLGRWSAAYIAHQPTRELDTSWFDYMAVYTGIIDDSVADDARRRFGDLPVAKFALAKHDMDAVNFMLTDAGDLVGIDFESTRFKPVGWDAITAAWALFLRFPGRDEEIVDALVAGWRAVGADHTPAAFREIALFFARRAARIDWAAIGGAD